MMKLPDASLQVNEKNFITIISSEESLKVCEHNFFHEI